MRLLRQIGTTPFAHGARTLDGLKPARLAEAVGTTRQTVETRLARLEAAGILQGYVLWPSFRHLGLRWDIYHWKVADASRKAHAFASIPLEDAIVGVYSFLGPDLCVDVRWRDEAEQERALAKVNELVGSAFALTLYARSAPPVASPLSPLDWRILAALRADARRPLQDVADEVGASLRTVKRRLARMSRDRAFDVTGRIALERSPRPIPLAFLFHFAPDGGKATATRLLELFDDRCIAAWVPPSPQLGNWDMSLYAETPGEIEALRAKAEAVEGVARVEVLLYTGARVDETWVDREIRRALLETQP